MPRLLRLLLSLAAVALCAPAAASAAVPGVNIAGAPTADRVQEAIDTGAQHVRIFALWRDFEPTGAADYPSPSDHNQRNLIKAYDDAIRQLNAAGRQPIFVVTEAPAWSNGGADTFTPPSNVDTYADFFGEFVAHNEAVGNVAAYEVWNEEDETVYWHPQVDPAKYTAMLEAAYAEGKAADPSATILVGPTTGNNYAWIEQLYNQGAKDSFDGVAVHTDTACLVNGPEEFYRDTGRLARFTFLGYREVRASMLANGDDKPIWMTELGWSSTNGGPTSCDRGTWAGQKPNGVSEAVQAEFLTRAFQCMANDPYVVAGTWFTMRETATGNAEMDHYGLLRTSGARKPAYDAFKAIAASGGGSAGPCGDFDAPQVKILQPAPGQQFVDKLDLQAAAVDGGVGLARITFNYNGGNEIRNYTTELANDRAVGLAPWQNSGKLPVGKHTIEVLALDKNGNVGRAEVEVEKVTKLASTLTPKVKLARKVKCKRRWCTLKGSLLRVVAGRPSITGKVAVEWQWRNKKGKYRKLSGGLKPANKPFTFRTKVKKAGRWRVRVTYQGMAPWKKVTSKYVYFRVR